MKALVVGAGGQLGRALVAQLGERVVRALAREELDIARGADVDAAVAAARPDVVFNAAADNRVDVAQTAPAGAFAVNAAGAWNLARAAERVGARLVHVSTDYVFDGRAGRPYTESDEPRPEGLYGASKRAGEVLVLAASPRALVVRTSGVFGAHGSKGKGGSFVERILRRARAGETLRVVDDQVLSPTYAPDLAGALVALAERGADGLVHVSNAGQCSWHALAVEALRLSGIDARVEAIKSADFAAAAPRPPFSVLANDRTRALGLAPLRPWNEALAAFLRTLA